MIHPAAPKISRPVRTIPPLPDKGGTGVAALEDDQYNERHYNTIVFAG